MIYSDLKCLIKMFDGCKNNPEILSSTKIDKYIPSGFTMSTILSFKSTENKHDLYRDKYLRKSFVNI